MEESLPNIKGRIRANSSYFDVSPTGGFYTDITGTSSSQQIDTASGTSNGGINFDASRSSTVYKDKAHVRPLSIATAFLIRY